MGHAVRAGKCCILLPSFAAETMVTRAAVVMLRLFAVSDALVPTGGEPGVAIRTAIASLNVTVSLSQGLTRPRLVTFGPATIVVCRPSGVLSTTSRVVMFTETTVATNCSVWAETVGVGRGGGWQALEHQLCHAEREQ